MVGVDAQSGVGGQDVAVGAQAVAYAVHGEAAAGVGDVDAVGAVGLHELGLAGEFGGFRHVGHHQESGDVHAQFAGGGDVLGGDVCLGAVGGDAYGADAQCVGLLEVVHRADAGEQQGGGDRLPYGVGDRLDPLPVGVGADAVGDAGAGQAVAVRDLDGPNAGRVEGAGDGAGLFDGVAVPDGVHPVPQGDVLDVQGGHLAASVMWWAARRSAVRSAAEVMMSRLPA